MGTTYGLQVLSPVVGAPLQVIATDLGDTRWKAGGITVDWAKVGAVSGSDVTLANGQVVRVGQKALIYGQIMTRITSGGTSGWFGPYDSAATDGRQTLTRGECYILNEAILETGPLAGLITGATMHPAVFDGGIVWYTRLLIGAATNPLGGPAGPTLVLFEGAFPAVTYVKS